jgi:hypothetical protein
MQELLEEFRDKRDFLALFQYSLELCKNEKLGDPKPRFDGILVMRILLQYVLKVEKRARKGIPTDLNHLRIDWNDALHETFVDDKVKLIRTFAKMHRMLVREAKPSERLTEDELDVIMLKMQEAFIRSYQQVDLTLDLMVDLMGDRNNMWKGLIPLVSDRDSMDYTDQFRRSLDRGDFEKWWVDSEEN